MAAAAMQQVRPAGARYEGLLLVLAAVCVIGILVMYVHKHGLDDVHDPLTEWQVSAFSTLTGADQAIYNALFTAKDDVPYLYEDINMLNKPGEKFRWPSLTDMQEALLPPFFRDKSWEQNGSLKWTLYEPLPEGEMQGSTMYLGTDGTQPQQGSFLLVMGHIHAGFQNTNAMVIWWNAKNHVVMPQSGFRDGLILQGWREVVPLSGAQEVKRIYGGDKSSEETKAADQAQADKAVQDLFGDNEMRFQLRSLLKALALTCIAALALGAPAAQAARLKVGVTLHPYYSFVANIVGDRADVIPLIDAEANPHGYQPQAGDMIRMMSMDVLVVNGIGHDTWAFEILDAAGMRKKLKLIYANDGVSLIPVAGAAAGEKVVNPHTFISTTAAIQQVYTIARKLGEIDTANAAYFRENARRYALEIRKLRGEFDAKIAGANLARFRCATMHSGYDYILQELGLQVTAVIEPRHGVEPTARQLTETIDRIKAAKVNVLFAEKYFASKLSDTIKRETGVKMYSISHISSGKYTPGKFIDEMRENLTTLATAINDASKGGA